MRHLCDKGCPGLPPALGYSPLEASEAASPATDLGLDFSPPALCENQFWSFEPHGCRLDKSPKGQTQPCSICQLCTHSPEVCEDSLG